LEFLKYAQIIERIDHIRQAFNEIMAAKSLVSKPSAKQWRFFHAAEAHLFDPTRPSEFDALSTSHAAQLKYEVEDKLRRHYLRPGRSVNFVFKLMHGSELHTVGLADGETYPSLAGYCLVVRDVSADVGKGSAPSLETLGVYLERVITEAIDAEFRAYAALPIINENDLLPWYCADGPALKEICNVLMRHKKKEWFLSNPLNPSTKRLISIKVKSIAESEAIVTTTEYWYLRWWSEKCDSYVYTYRETNRQTYILRKEEQGWKVFQNLRPIPRTTTPNRWRKVL